MGKRDLEDIAILVGLGIVGVFAAQKFFPNKSPEEILEELTTSLTSFLDTIKLPALPEIPTTNISLPSAQAQTPLPPASTNTLPPPTPIIDNTPTSASPSPPQKEVMALPIPISPKPPKRSTEPVSTTPAAQPTNTVSSGETEPIITEPPVKPRGSGQLPNNPTVPPPPAGSGGAIIAFAGDWDSNNKSVATTAAIEKAGCQLIVGVGDYSYTDQKATDWFAKNVGAKWKGKMKGAYGNHDTHDSGGFLSLFGQTGWNMGVKVAPNLTVVFIDTEKGITQSVLESLTKAAKAQSKHVAYVYHKPHYTSSDAHHKGSENKWGSIIDSVGKANGVKLQIAGHNHNYEHFFNGGVHYVCSGAAGRKFYTTGCKAAGAVKCVNNTNGFLKVAVGNSLLCQFLSNSGELLDSFTIS